jgi:hypothetical protein
VSTILTPELEQAKRELQATGYEVVKRVSDEDIRSFEMPKPELGMPVIWWRSGLRITGGAEVVFVRKINGRSVDLSNGYTNVLHADDPRIHQNVHQREMGSWEYTPYHLKMLDRMERLEKALKEVVGDEGEKSKKK